MSTRDPPQGAAQVATGGTVLLLGGLGGRALFYLSSLLLTHLLPVSEVGRFFMVFAIGQGLVLASTLGLEPGLLRFGPRVSAPDRRAQLDALLQGALLSSFAASLVVAALVWRFAPSLARTLEHPELAMPLTIFGCILPALSLQRLLGAFCLALYRVKVTVAIRNVLYPALFVISLPIALHLLPSARGAFVSLGIGAGLSALFGASWLFRKERMFRPGAILRWDASRQLLRFSGPLMLGALVGYAAMWIDSLIVGTLLPPSALAHYGIAYRISMLGAILLEAFNGSMGPAASRLLEQSSAKLEQLYRDTTRIAMSLFLPICVVLVIFPAPFLELFGAGYATPEAILALRILLAGQLANVMVGGAGILLVMAGYRWLNLFNLIAMTVVVAASCWVWVPTRGIVGAACGSAAGVAFVNFIRLVEVRVLLSMHPFSSRWWRLLASVGLAAAVGTAVQTVVSGTLGQWAGISTTIMAYVATRLLLGLEAEERRWMSWLLGGGRGEDR